MEMSKINSTTLDNIILKSNIPECQANLIQEIFNASKVKCSKQNRYSDNWLLFCLLFNIRLFFLMLIYNTQINSCIIIYIMY